MVSTAEDCIDAERLYILTQEAEKPLPPATIEQAPPVSAPQHAVEARPAGSAWALNTNYVTLLDLYYKGALKYLAWYRGDNSVALIPLVAFAASATNPQFVFAAVLSSTTLHVFTVGADSSIVYTTYDIGGGGGGVTPEYVNNAVAAEAALRIAADANLQWQIDNIHIDVPIDSELDLSSTNPVENRVVTGAVNEKQDQIPQEQLDEMTDQEIDDLIASLV